MKFDLTLCRRLWSVITGVALLCLAAPAAIAVPITYVFSGPATGTLAGTPFTGAQVTITATADTANVTMVPFPCVNLDKVTISISGLSTVQTTGSNSFQDNGMTSLWRLLSGDCGAFTGDWLDQSNALAISYSLITALGPTTGTQAAAGSVATTGGTLTFIAIPLTFQAIRNATIPTLNRWGLLLLGILLTGAAFFSLRRRIFSRR